MYRSRWESSNKALLEMAEEVKNILLFVAVMQMLDPEKTQPKQKPLCCCSSPYYNITALLFF